MITLPLLCSTASWHRCRERWSLLAFTICLMSAPLIIEPQVENDIPFSRNISKGIPSKRWGRELRAIQSSYSDDNIDTYDRHEISPKERNSTPSPGTIPAVAPIVSSPINPSSSIDDEPTRNINTVPRAPISTTHPTISPSNKPTPALSGTSTMQSPTERLNTDAPTPGTSEISPTLLPTDQSITNVPTSNTFGGDQPNSMVSSKGPHSQPTGTSNPTLSPISKPISNTPSTEESVTSSPSLLPTGTFNPTLSPTAKSITDVPTSDSSSTTSLNSQPTSTSIPSLSPTSKSITDVPTSDIFSTRKPSSQLTGAPNPTLSPSAKSITDVPTSDIYGTASPTSQPTGTPTLSPTSESVTHVPTSDLSGTSSPTAQPTGISNPTLSPSAKSITDVPTSDIYGTASPNSQPTGTPTLSPTSKLVTPTPYSSSTSSPTARPTGISDPTLPPSAKSITNEPTPSVSKTSSPTHLTRKPTSLKTNHPTSIPSLNPVKTEVPPSPFICKNTRGYLYKSKRRQTCAWVTHAKARQRRLCAMEDVSQACPISCGRCCADDSNFTFEIHNKKLKKCDWIAANPTKRLHMYCTKRYIMDRCTLTCDNCRTSPTSPTTLTPTAVPTAIPSLSPTLIPSLSPTPRPSAYPTLRPSTSPTLMSSIDPTIRPSNNLTTGPPGNSPITSTSCADLIYTDFGGVEKGSISVLQFDYEIERDPSIPGSLLWDILPNVESGLTSFLIQDLLPACKNDELLRAIGNNRSRRLGELVGISSQPIDVLDEASKCQSLIGQSSVCTPIRGGVSLYLKDNSNGIDYAAHSSIKKIMDDGLLLSAHDSILKVIYVSKVQLRNDIGDDTGDNGQYLDEETEFWNSLYFRGIMLGIMSGCVTIFTIKCIVNRGCRNRRSVISDNPSDWTEIAPVADYSNSSDSTTTSDDETILTSNKVGSIVRTIKTEEMVVDVDIESHSIGLHANKKIGKHDEYFDVIFEDETKEKKMSMADDHSDLTF